MCPSSDWVSAGFTPAIGSSSMIIFGSLISARAISSSLRWPARQAAGVVVAFLCSSLNRSSSSSRLLLDRSPALPQNGLNSALEEVLAGLLRRRPSIMLSITVIRLSALVSWKVRTMPARATLEAEVLSSVSPSKVQCAPCRTAGRSR